METRLGFIGIVIQQMESAESINRILSAFGAIIRGRIGIPDPQKGSAVIGLIVEGTNDQVGALTGKLGNLPGVTVKSALASRKNEKKKEGFES